MPVFPSAAWAEALREALNANPAYAEAAAAWEGDFLLVMTPEPEHPGGLGVHLDLFRGQCRSARFVEPPTGATSEFTVEGSRATWERLFRGEIEPIPAIMGGTLRLKGNMMKAMRFTRAAQEMLRTAASVPRDP